MKIISFRRCCRSSSVKILLDKDLYVDRYEVESSVPMEDEEKEVYKGNRQQAT